MATLKKQLGTRVKPRSINKCEWCEDLGNVKVAITDLEGVLKDVVVLCSECAKRGVTWNGRAIDAAI